MNSKQRRSKRVFEHEVTLVPKHGERWLDYDRRVELAKQWLQWRSKRKNYTTGPALFDRKTFKFRCGGLACAFALKWT